MDIMTAGVGHGYLHAGVQVDLGDRRGGVVLAGLLDHGEAVDVATHCNDRAITIPDDAHHAGVTDAENLVEAVGREFRLDPVGGLEFLERKFRILMEVFIQRFPVVPGVIQVGEDGGTFYGGLRIDDERTLRCQRRPHYRTFHL